MSDFGVQIVSGVVVSFVSFGFGYFLFRSQTNEQIRLEVYRRRLDCYDKVVAYMDDLDYFSHNGVIDSSEERQKYIRRLFQLTANVAPYVPTKVHELLGELVDNIDGLPDSLAYLEQTYEKILHTIEKDVGIRLTNWRVDFINRDDSGKKFDKHFEGNQD